jgi:hypothetical protein
MMLRAPIPVVSTASGEKMKLATLGALVSAGLVVLFVGASPSGEVHAQRFAEPRAAGHDASQSAELITLSATASDESGKSVQQVTIIDPKSRVMAVYHVAAGQEKSGEIELKSVRKFDWDLQMEEFNATNPLPREVRSQIAPNYHQR